MLFRRTLLGLAAVALVSSSRTSEARAVGEELGGHLEATVDGRVVPLPMLHSDFSVNIDGDLAGVTVVQTFENPTRQPLNATYLFPLSEGAAVDAMTMQVGNQTIRAQIRERDQARQEYEQARSEGRAAALLTQHRPNMFTQQVANLMPGAPVRVTIHYAQVVPRVDGAYELVVPMVVGPRYNPAPSASSQAASERPSPANGGWTIAPPPAYPHAVFGLTLPNVIPPDRVSMHVSLAAPFAIASVTSATHPLAVSGAGDHRAVSFQAGSAIDNRDFILRYSLAGGAVQTGVMTHRDARGGFFSLVVEPPAAPTDAQITPREIVFVLDTSGSMDGEPIEASKAFMQDALRTLRPTDYYRIVQFDSTPREFSEGPAPATAQNIAAGQRFVSGLTAQGGTELMPAMRQAFGASQQPNTLRIVVFLSDGYIGNEAEVLSDMSRMMGQARVYAFGVGTSPNRYLLSEMARRGRGFARYIDPTESSLEAAHALAQRLDTPVLTDIRIDWGALNPTEVTPAILPDLFAGESLRVMGRFGGAREATVMVSGNVNGRPASLPVHVRLTDAADTQASASAIPAIWARSQIEDLMRDYTSPAEVRITHANNDDLQARVTRLGLDYALMTNWTSFVAVSQNVVNPNAGSAQDADVPLPMPAGVGPNAYGETVGGSSFGGAPAPEPAELALFALLLAIAAAMFVARRARIGGAP
ncbi:MAG: VWA domain-containing protein [Proteobacteria bacterium]|nr:VWA domain-containing protein [Pseudomonadota bacterium]